MDLAGHDQPFRNKEDKAVAAKISKFIDVHNKAWCNGSIRLMAMPNECQTFAGT